MTTTNMAAVFAAMASGFIVWVSVPASPPSSASVEAGHGIDVSICASSPEIAGPDCGSVGDDNGDGWIMEDESGWDCSTMGNHVCGLPPNDRR